MIELTRHTSSAQLNPCLCRDYLAILIERRALHFGEEEKCHVHWAIGYHRDAQHDVLGAWVQGCDVPLDASAMFRDLERRGLVLTRAVMSSSLNGNELGELAAAFGAVRLPLEKAFGCDNPCGSELPRWSRVADAGVPFPTVYEISRRLRRKLARQSAFEEVNAALAFVWEALSREVQRMNRADADAGMVAVVPAVSHRPLQDRSARPARGADMVTNIKVAA